MDDLMAALEAGTTRCVWCGNAGHLVSTELGWLHFGCRLYAERDARSRNSFLRRLTCWVFSRAHGNISRTKDRVERHPQPGRDDR